MGSRRCCCCPICTAQTTTCCTCVCLTLCITFTPSDYSCDPEYLEVDWDEYEQAYVGTLAGHDLRYYFESEDDEYGNRRCYFKLDSYSLGNHRWKAGSRDDDEIACLELNTEVEVEETYGDDCSGGIISTFCVDWVTPTKCDNCDCLCERICVHVTKTPYGEDAQLYAGFVYWDEYEQAYVGTLGSGYDTIDVSFPVDRWGDVCDPEEDYDCDFYDDSCAIGVTADGSDGPWYKMVNCDTREVTYAWQWTDEDLTDWEIDIECYNCGGDCDVLIPSPCCPDTMWPTTLTATVCFTWGHPDIPIEMWPELLTRCYTFTLTWSVEDQQYYGVVAMTRPAESARLWCETQDTYYWHLAIKASEMEPTACTMGSGLSWSGTPTITWPVDQMIVVCDPLLITGYNPTGSFEAGWPSECFDPTLGQIEVTF